MIYDIIRKKFVVLTPEEYVRQHVVHYIISHLGYPKHLVNVEKMVKFNQTRRRLDVVVFNKNMQTEIIVECKATDISLDDQVCRQIAIYQYALPCRYLLITNGLMHFVFEKELKGDEIVWKHINSLPNYHA